METQSEWFMRKFLEWERTTNRRQPITEFARHIGFKQSTFAKWLSGDNTPDARSLEQIAIKLDDFSIYDVVGVDRPSITYQLLSRDWDKFDSETRFMIISPWLNYLKINEPNSSTIPVLEKLAAADKI